MDEHGTETKKTRAPERAAQALMHEQIALLLVKLGDGWSITPSGHLHKIYRHATFMQAMAQANVIAHIAEEEAHHPDLTICFGICEVEIWTHTLNGLTDADFILAAKIEEACS